MNPGAGKHRLKKEELILNIFEYFSEKYDSEFNKTIFDIKIPIEEVKNYLEKKHKIQYTSNSWIYTQIKRYETYLNEKLLEKIKSEKNTESFYLSIYRKMSSYTQFQHLHITQKIKIANGIYDLILNSLDDRDFKTPLNILLGSGTNNYHLANIIKEKAAEKNIHFNIYTHNFGIQRNLMLPENKSEYINIYTPSGIIDPEGNTIMGTDNQIFLNTDFNFIVQSTNTIYDKKLYVHTEVEGQRKKVILKECKGSKILALVMDEFKNSFDYNMFNYGELSDYDFIVVPRTRGNRQKEYENILNKINDIIHPEIVHWHYTIYKVKK